MRKLLGALLCLPLAAASAQDAAVHADPATQLKFPAKLGGLDYARVVTYGTEELGYCVVYAADMDFAQICVYNRGHKDLPTGVAGAEFKAELATSVEGAVASLNRPPYEDGKEFAHATPTFGSEVSVATLEARLFRSTLKLAGQPPQPQTHLLLMTAGLGKFLKVNYTLRSQDSKVFAQRTQEFITGFASYNSEVLKALLLPRAAASTP